MIFQSMVISLTNAWLIFPKSYKKVRKWTSTEVRQMPLNGQRNDCKAKIEAIEMMSFLMKVKWVMSFFRYVDFYYRFIKDF